ncbi:MAG: GGDEF domain-containing protein [Acidobacteriota bacterium]
MKELATGETETAGSLDPRGDWTLRTAMTATGPLDRASFLQAAQEEFHRARTYRLAFGVALMRIDSFNTLRVDLGEEACREMVETIASMCLTNLRRSDIFGQIGPSYFAVLCPCTPMANVARMCERLRRTLADFRLVSSGADVRVTASFGVTDLEPEDRDFKDMLRRAAQALRQANLAGGNQVCW